MSVINNMLKDLEKRRSPDLETSDTLRQNISWDSSADHRSFNWKNFVFILIVIGLIVAISFLLWERNALQQVAGNQDLVASKKVGAKKIPAQNSVSQKKTIPIPRKQEQKIQVAVQDKTDIATKPVISAEIIKEKQADTSVNVDEHEELELAANSVEKRQRPLNKEQLAEVAFQKARQYMEIYNTPKAQDKLREALTLYPPHIKAREILSGYYIKAGRYVEAAELLKQGTSVVPGHALFAKLYARVLLEQNNPKLAIEVLEKRAPAIAQNMEYHALLAATYQRVKDHKKAIATYLKLVKIKPSVGIWWLGLAISLEKSGNAKDAVDAYQRAQQTGNLSVGLTKFTTNRVSALHEAGLK